MVRDGTIAGWPPAGPQRTMTSSRELTESSHERVRDDAVVEHRFVLGVPESLAVFADHFPGAPLLPAFIQLTEVIRRINRVWPDLGAWSGASAMKFKSPIRPGSDIVLDLRRVRGTGEVQFSISREHTACASGTLLFTSTEAETA